MKTRILLFALSMLITSTFAQRPHNYNQQRIQVALLLDTSGSMQGLINQARSQLWTIINELTWVDYGQNPPYVELSLYEFGSSNIPSRFGHIRQIVPFTTDLDWVSAELFSLRTGGSAEFCGQVIDMAAQQLTWTNHPNDLRLIFIAGNESFAQGPVDFRGAIVNSVNRGISVNTIFCGRYSEGQNLLWEEGAYLGQGQYMNIDHNTSTDRQMSPQDQQLLSLNDQLNQTYLPYGPDGYSMQQRQIAQDKNVSRYGKSNMAQRVMTKASPVYNNSKWDLIDAIDNGQVRLENIPDNELPSAMRGKTIGQKRVYLNQTRTKRKQVQSKILALGKTKRAADKQLNKNTPTKTLDKAIVESVNKQKGRTITKRDVNIKNIPTKSTNPTKANVSSTTVKPTRPTTTTKPTKPTRPTTTSRPTTKYTPSKTQVTTPKPTTPTRPTRPTTSQPPKRNNIGFDINKTRTPQR